MLDIMMGNKMKKIHSKLRWSIHSLHEGENAFHCCLSAAELDLDAEKIALEEPIECTITLTKSGRKVYLEGEASFSLRLECARCFAAFTLKCRETLTAYYITERNPYHETEGLSKEDVLSEQYHEDTIDAQNLLHDTIMLAQPMKPLCSAACKGLCPICGQNLNTGTCSCTKDTTDPRWGPLKKLMK